MGKVTRSYGIRVLVAYIPSKAGVYDWLLDRVNPLISPKTEGQSAFSRVLEEICQANSFGFIDLEPVMRAESERVYEESGDLLWWRDDTHWNGKGHLVAAQAISEWLRHHSD